MRLIDHVGKRYGALTVVSRDATRPDGTASWVCRCDCGTVISVRGPKLSGGHTQSCGCHRALNNFKHGHATAQTAEYRSWAAMKARCFNKSHPAYLGYGGRGITVCARWRDSFENFLADMGERPEGTSIDRIDVNGNYEPENCRWANQSTQAINRRPYARHRCRYYFL